MGPLSAFVLALSTPQAICAESSYLEAVELYRAGDYPSALERFRALGGPREPEGETDDACVATLSLLETEIGALHATEARWSASLEYFEAAWEASLSLRDGDRRTRFQKRWLLFTGLLYQNLVFTGEPSGALAGADTYLERAVERFPHDPEVLLAGGAFLEWASSVGHRDAARDAEALYEAALRADPALAAAHVRLGWIRLFQLNSDRDAGASLREGLRLAAKPILIYRARMGLGRLAEKEGSWAEAARQYEAAIEVAPGWQVGHTALAYALYRDGQRSRAREILAASARIPDSNENLLGWWSYELGSSPEAENFLLQLRAEVAR